MTTLTYNNALNFINKYKGYADDNWLTNKEKTLMIKKLQQEHKQEVERTKQILKETAEKIKIDDIKAGLLLMAWNLDKLEEMNKAKFKGTNKAKLEPQTKEKEQVNIKLHKKHKCLRCDNIIPKKWLMCPACSENYTDRIMKEKERDKD